MKKTIAVALVVFFMLNNIYNTSNINVSAENTNNQIILSYSFDDLEIEETAKFDGNNYTNLKISDDVSFSYTSEPGEPRIPYKEARIGLPVGEKFESVQVTKDNVVSYSVDLLVEPAQEAIPMSYDEDEIFFDMPKDSIYNSDGFYPDKDYEIVTTQCFRGYTILIMRLYPVKYIPTEDRIELYKSIKIVVKTSTLSDTEDTPDNYRGLQKDYELIKTMIDNPITLEKQHLPLNTISTDETYELVIITNNNLKNYQGPNNFQDLANAKANIGINTKIKTVEEIGSTSDKIRDFIKDAYNNWHTDYVLLGGGKNIVPVKSVSVRYSAGSSTTPCDLYYACLDSPAPNGKENCDLIAEVYVGRTLADTSAEVSNFVKKTIAYMNTNDDYIKNALWVGEWLGFGGVADHGKNMIEQHIGRCDDDDYVTNGLPEDGSDGYDVTRLYDGWSASTLISKFNSGNFHLVDQISHGNEYLWAKHMNGDYVDDLTNTNYFFLYSQTCKSAYFINLNCFADSLTVNSGGPFAIIMNAALGLQYKRSTDGPNNRFARCFWNAIYGKRQPIFGQAFYTSKLDNLVKIGEQGMTYTYYSVVFLGDPSLVVKGTKPQLMYNPSSHDFGNMKKGETNTTTFKIWNYGEEEMQYTLSAEYDWVTVSPTQGSSSNNQRNIINVNINTAGLSDGTHSCDINIQSGTDQRKFKITVTVGATLAYNPKSYRVCLPNGKEDMDYFHIWNGGLETLHYSLTCNADWISLYTTSGESTGPDDVDAIIFKVNSSKLEHGWHESTINIDTNAEDEKFTVRLGVDGPDIPENIEPKNNETGLGKDVKLSVKVFHHKEKTMNVYFYNAKDNSKIGTDTDVPSGGTATTNWEDLEYGTTYRWYAIADDKDMETQSDTFSFTTNSPPTFSDIYPQDGLKDVSTGIEKISINITDPDNDTFSWTITTSPDIGSSSGNSNTYSTQDCRISNLQPKKQYNWTVEAYDGTSGTTKKTYTFTTKENSPPNKPLAVNPINNEQETSIICTLNWTCQDPDQDQLTYTLYFGTNQNPPSIIEDITENQYTIPYDLELNTNYYWKVIATDPLEETSESTLWSFKTSPDPPRPPYGSISIGFPQKRSLSGIKADITNIGVRDASGINWEVKITGGVLKRINITKSGTITRLNKTEDTEISSHKFLELKTKVFGFGKVDINVIISNDEDIVSTKTREAFIIGPLISLRD